MDSPVRSDDSRFLDALKRLWKSLFEGLGQRFDLFSLELEEEKRRIFGVVFLAMVSAFSAFIAFLCLNLVVILLSWDGNRLLVVVLMAAFYLLLSAGVAVWLRHRIRNAPQPFSATLEEHNEAVRRYLRRSRQHD